MYFSCNLPNDVPYWIHAEKAPELQAVLNRVHRRMEMLERALQISGMAPAKFCACAAKVFRLRGESFDKMTARNIASCAKLLDDGSPAPERKEWPNATVLVDTAFVSVKDWEGLRMLGIGGSDAAVVLNRSPYQTQRGLYHEKIGTPACTSDSASDWVLARGHAMEDRVIDAFCNATGAHRLHETRMFASKKYPHCTANIDDIVEFDDGRIFVFESKTTVAENTMAWAADKIPAHYVPQMRQYPAVLDDDRICGTYIGCLFTDDIVFGGTYVGSAYDLNRLAVRFLERDPAAEDAQLKIEQEWFEENVEQNLEPPLTGDPDKEISVLMKYERNPQAQTMAPETWDILDVGDLVSQWEHYAKEESEMNNQIKVISDAKREVAAKMIEKLNGNTAANVSMSDGSGIFEIKNTPRKKTSVDTEKLMELVDIASGMLPESLTASMRDCIKTTPDAFRVFSIRRKIGKKL